MCLLLTQKPRCAYTERDTHRSSCILISLPILLQVIKPDEGPSWEVPLSLRRGCPLLVFSSFFWALTVEYLGEIKKTGPDSQCKNSDHLFVGPSHFLNGRSPIPTMGYYLSNPSTHFKCSLAIHPQHTIKVLLDLHVIRFSFSFSFQFSIHINSYQP